MTTTPNVLLDGNEVKFKCGDLIRYSCSNCCSEEHVWNDLNGVLPNLIPSFCCPGATAEYSYHSSSIDRQVKFKIDDEHVKRVFITLDNEIADQLARAQMKSAPIYISKAGFESQVKIIAGVIWDGGNRPYLIPAEEYLERIGHIEEPIAKEPPHLNDVIQDVKKIQSEVARLYSENKTPLYEEFVAELFKDMGDFVSNIHHAATGIAGEAGEVLDLSKKTWVNGRTMDYENMVEELSDIRFYYQAMLNLLGLTDLQVCAYNQNKLLKRFPDGEYSDELAQLRLDKNE